MALTLDRGASVRYLRRMAATWEVVLGTVGGIMSIFVGFSFVCIFEIVYFFTLRKKEASLFFAQQITVAFKVGQNFDVLEIFSVTQFPFSFIRLRHSFRCFCDKISYDQLPVFTCGEATQVNGS